MWCDDCEDIQYEDVQCEDVQCGKNESMQM